MSLFAKAKKARENKKGFTLVELIVVLVILAILAAILVPALLGWIDEAKKKQYVLDARNIYMATQTVADERYAALDDPTGKTYALDTAGTDKARILKLSDMTGKADITSVTAEGYKITGIGISFTDGTTATLADNAWSIS